MKRIKVNLKKRRKKMENEWRKVTKNSIMLDSYRLTGNLNFIWRKNSRFSIASKQFAVWKKFFFINQGFHSECGLMNGTIQLFLAIYHLNEENLCFRVGEKNWNWWKIHVKRKNLCEKLGNCVNRKFFRVKSFRKLNSWYFIVEKFPKNPVS